MRHHEAHAPEKSNPNSKIWKPIRLRHLYGTCKQKQPFQGPFVSDWQRLIPVPNFPNLVVFGKCLADDVREIWGPGDWLCTGAGPGQACVRSKSLCKAPAAVLYMAARAPSEGCSCRVPPRKSLINLCVGITDSPPITSVALLSQCGRYSWRQGVAQ